MFSLVPAVALGLSLAGTVAADFSLYYHWTDALFDGGDGEYYIFYNSPPDCDDVGNAYTYNYYSDISSTQGVRCDGQVGMCHGSNPDLSINAIEWNTGSSHWTWYAESGELVDVDNNHIGTCYIDQSDDYKCGVGIGYYNGQRVLFCETDQVPATMGN